MAVKGRLWGIKYGNEVHHSYGFAIAAPATVTMATLNNGWAARFMATQNKDIYSVKINWSSVASPGQVTVRIETDNAGKPSGSLYDANAVSTAVVPTAGIQTITFPSHPTTKLTVGTVYYVVILTTTGGTTQTLRSHPNIAQSAAATRPLITLTATDGTTRANFAEVNSTIPIASFLLDDASEDSMGMATSNGTNNNINLITTAGAVAVAGIKLVTDATLSVAAVEFVIQKTGTPTADLRIRIYDSGNSLVTGSTIVVPVNSVTNSVTSLALFGGLISLVAGTYRVVFDGAADTSSSNCWVFRAMGPFSAATGSSGLSMTTAPDIASPSWTDTTDMAPVALVLDDLTVPASSGMIMSRVQTGM